MRKQSFDNGEAKPKVIKSKNDKFIQRLKDTKSVLDFYNQKQKIIELLQETCN